MSRVEAILVGIVIVTVIMALSLANFQTHLCKSEAIKSGMNGDEVIKACGR